MTTILIVVVSVVVGVVLGALLGATAIQSLRRKNRELRTAIKEGREPKSPETMKLVVWACVANGCAWVWCSYILAAMDKPQIAEELSKVALIEIIAPVAVYAVKSAIENLSKNNRWPDRPEAIGDKPEEKEDTE